MTLVVNLSDETQNLKMPKLGSLYNTSGSSSLSVRMAYPMLRWYLRFSSSSSSRLLAAGGVRATEKSGGSTGSLPSRTGSATLITRLFPAASWSTRPPAAAEKALPRLLAAGGRAAAAKSGSCAMAAWLGWDREGTRVCERGEKGHFIGGSEDGFLVWSGVVCNPTPLASVGPLPHTMN
jgi:hypothetical protein